MPRLSVPSFLKNLFDYDTRMKLRQAEADLHWYLSGMPNPPIYSYKRKMILRLAKDFPAKIFIETGTCSGDTVDSVRKRFSKIYSIELDEGLALKAKKRFEKQPHIEILQGDSGRLLKQVLQEVEGPIVFWLDGHYSGEGTAKSDIETPIFEELKAIFEHECKNHLILIDDARCFDGTHDYPTLEGLKEYVMANNPKLHLSVQHDVIIIK